MLVRRGGTLVAAIEFDVIVDPQKELLVTREELLAISGGRKFWRTQASGIRIPPSIANRLEQLGASPTASLPAGFERSYQP